MGEESFLASEHTTNSFSMLRCAGKSTEAEVRAPARGRPPEKQRAAGAGGVQGDEANTVTEMN